MKIRSRWLTFALAWLAVGSMRCLFATCRKVYVASEDYLRLDRTALSADPERFILTTWHDSLLVPTFASPAVLRYLVCCLVSRHQDGSYLAEAMDRMGYTTIRGSSSKGGAQALRQLIDETDGKHIVITPDGPRGPRRELKAGAVYLASQTGRRIVCGAYSCRREWRPKGSWTDMLIPLPFTTIYLLASEPITIPPEITRENLHAQLAIVQGVMDRLNQDAEALAGRATVQADAAPANRESAAA